MTALHVTLIASAAVNVLALWGWWDSLSALARADRQSDADLTAYLELAARTDTYADTLRRQHAAAVEAHIETLRELNRLRLEWPRRDPVTGRYTKKG